MRVFEARHHLCFGLKTADEVGMIGELRQNYLDSDLSSYDGLVGAVNCPEASHANAFTQLKAANDPIPGCSERRV